MKRSTFEPGATASSSRLSVPLALTVKSVKGSRAAQSCEGCAAVWIANSMELAHLRLSENLREEIAANPTLEIEGDPEPLDFDESGNLHNLMEAAMVGH